jgi:mandelamide amidase
LAATFAEQRVDALMFPTVPMPTAEVDADGHLLFNGQRRSAFEVFVRNTTLASVLGLPGISLPMGLSSAGLPMGIELDGPAGSDRALLGIAAALEALLPALPRPPLWVG